MPKDNHEYFMFKNAKNKKSVHTLRARKPIHIEQNNIKHLLVVSGGLDTIGLAYLLDYYNIDFDMLFFTYGQNNLKEELTSAKYAAHKLNKKLHIQDLTMVGEIVVGSHKMIGRNGRFAWESMAFATTHYKDEVNIVFGTYLADSDDGSMKFFDHLLKAFVMGEEVYSDNNLDVNEDSHKRTKLNIVLPLEFNTKMDLLKTIYELYGEEFTKDYITHTVSCLYGNECHNCIPCFHRDRVLQAFGEWHK